MGNRVGRAIQRARCFGTLINSPQPQEGTLRFRHSAENWQFSAHPLANTHKYTRVHIHTHIHVHPYTPTPTQPNACSTCRATT